MFYTGGVYKKIHKLLKLDKSLVVFDVETTGKNISSDKLLSLSLIKVMIDGRTVRKENFFFNPGIDIDSEASAVHGIKSKQAKDNPEFKESAQIIFDLFSNCYYAGYNVMNFDLPILRREFLRLGMNFEYDEERVIDSKRIFKYMVPQTLSAAYKYYCKEEYEMKHSAVEDTEVAAKILLKQLEGYQEVRDWDFIKKINEIDEEERADENTRKFFWKNGIAYFAFSKYRGKSIYDIVEKDPKFLEWMMQADFTKETKSVIGRVLEKDKDSKKI